MFPPTDNPAQRLLEILSQARPMDNHPIQKIWGDVFEIKVMDAPTCYRILGHLNNLVDSVELRVKQIEDLNHELYLRDLPTIRRILCPDSITTSWHSVKKPLDHGVLTGLEFCANELSRLHDEDQIETEVLEEIRSEFASLFEQVANAGVPSNLKLILYDILTAALLAIDQYKILGNDGLKRSIAYTLGMLSLHRDEFLSEKKSSLISKTLHAVKSLCDAVALACKVKELGTSIRNLLE